MRPLACLFWILWPDALVKAEFQCPLAGFDLLQHVLCPGQTTPLVVLARGRHTANRVMDAVTAVLAAGAGQRVWPGSSQQELAYSDEL